MQRDTSTIRRALPHLLALLTAGPALSQACGSGPWTALGDPRGAMFHELVFDSQRGVVVTYGGYTGFAPLDGTFEWNGCAWSERAAAGPGARYAAGLAYDSVRGRTVLYGGADAAGNYLGDTWEYDGTAWTPATFGGGPPGRAVSGMAYDSARGRIVLHGGLNASSGALTETWEYDGTTWSLASTTGPGRAYVRLAYDSARQRTVMFGGWDGSPHDDTWEWDGVAWTQTATGGPSARYGSALAYDAARGRTILFAGEAGQVNFQNDTWEYDGATAAWTQIATQGAPSPRDLCGGCFDAARGEFVVFAGYEAPATAARADTWVYDAAAATWTERSAALRPTPGPRGAAQVSYDSLRGRALVYGGSAGGALLGDAWSYDGGCWSPLAGGFGARSGGAMTYDAARDRHVFFGGADAVAVRGDTWEMDPATGLWSAVSLTGPSPRLWHSLTYDAARGKTVLFGGYPGGFIGSQPPTNDTWEWDGVSWTAVPAPAAPSPRIGHAATFDAVRGRVVLFGGYDGPQYLSDTWEYDGATWVQTATAGPSPRNGASLVFAPLRARTILFGGQQGSAFYGGPSSDETWEYDGFGWTLTATGGATSRHGHAGFFDAARNEVVVYGGYDFVSGATLGDVFRMDAGTTGPAVVASDPVDVLAAFGHTAAFSASSPNAATYAWSKDGVPLSDGGGVAGSTTSRLVLSGVGPADDGVYACTVANACGSATTAGAALTTRAAVLRTVQPSGPGSLEIRHETAFPLATVFHALSFDPLNVANPGGGGWFGLHISIQALVGQFLFGAPPFHSQTDALGDASLALPAGAVSFLAGLPYSGVDYVFDPATQFFLAASNLTTMIVQ